MDSEFRPFKWIAGAALVLVFLGFAASTTYKVEQYEVALRTTNGEVTAVQSAGRYLKVPFFQEVHFMRTDLQNIQPGKEAVNTYTEDNQEVDIRFNIHYRVPVDKAQFVYTNVQDYRERLYNVAVDRLKAEMGKINVSSFAGKRGEIRDRVEASIKQASLALGVEVMTFQLTDVEYTKSFREAVNQAAVQKAGVETQEYKRQQAEKDAEKAKVEAKGKADAAIEAATGSARAIELEAKANAYAIEIKGKAEAEAIRLKAAALAQNGQLVELTKAQNWDGKSQVWVPVNNFGQVTPLMTMPSPR